MTLPIVKRFLISLDENKWLGLLGVAICVTGSAFFALQTTQPQPKRFKVIGEISFRNQPLAFTSTGEQIQEQGRQNVENLTTQNLFLNRVSQRTNLPVDRLQAILNDRIKIEGPNEESNSIILEYQNTIKPEDIKPLLQIVMEELVEASRFTNKLRLRSKIQQLEERLTRVRPELIAAEELLYRYISNEGSSLLAVQDGSLFAGITNSQAKQREIQLALDQIEGQINSLVTQLGLSPQQAYTQIALSADPIIASLRAQILQNELQNQLLEQNLRPEHPKMLELQIQKTAYEKLLVERAREIIGDDGILTSLPSEIRKDSNLDKARQDLANKLVTLQTNKEGLIQQLNSLQTTERQLRRQYEEFPDRQIQQSRLIEDVEFQRAIYKRISQQLIDARSAEAETIGSLIVSTPAFIQAIPAPPLTRTSPFLVIGAGFIIGILVGGGIIFLLAIIDDRLHTPQEIREALVDRDIFLLGQLPHIEILNDKEEEIPIVINNDPQYLQFYERFRSNIRRLGSESTKIVVITSTINGEGKTVSAYNLAIASANAGKRTLLIEGDLRSASAAGYFGINLDSQINVEPLRYYKERNNCTYLVPEIENLYVVPNPGPQRRAAAIIESDELRLLIEDAKKRFDFVVIDTPSLAQSNDALLLEPFADEIVLVSRPSVTRGTMFQAALDELIEAELPLLGAIINDVDNLFDLVRSSSPEKTSAPMSKV